MVDLASRLESLPRARRLTLAEVVGDALAIGQRLGRLYTEFAARAALDPLKAALTELAAGKAGHAAALEPLARALGAAPTSPTSVATAGAPRAAGDSPAALFGEAFQGERALDVVYRELAALLAGPDLLPELPDLAAGAARARGRLRELYLRYS